MAKQRTVTDKQVDEAISLYEAKVSLADIEKATGVPGSTLYLYLKQRGLGTDRKASGTLSAQDVKTIFQKNSHEIINRLDKMEKAVQKLNKNVEAMKETVLVNSEVWEMNGVVKDLVDEVRKLKFEKP
jgi:hypothetical protein|tara:strand:+ start:1061 stop:1444 length:384 start_codon:yes stop_codon:yes gene_type:complete